MHPRKFPGPNEEVLEAQARVCTGPQQTRPLGMKPDDPQPGRILELIIRSARAEIPWKRRASRAQMGAFFAAMAIRRGFGGKTGWSPAEAAAFEYYGPELDRCLPAEVRFLLRPENGYRSANSGEGIVAASLAKILGRNHLSYEETRRMLDTILRGEVAAALKAAALIGQRMNLESYAELRGYLDAVGETRSLPCVSTDSLTHFGQPFDGAARYLRPTIFVAAVRSALGRPSILYGVEEMPPKNGITEEKVLKVLGARTNLSPPDAAALIENPKVGFAYLSQREYAPRAFAMLELRAHIKKRPPWATTEKAQQIFSCAGSSYMVVGFFHSGYEEPLLRSMWERGFDAGMVVKGEEGSSHYALRLGKPSGNGRKAVNFTQGFRRVGDGRNDFSADVNPREFGFVYDHSPRLEAVSPEAFAKAGTAALSGERGHVYDRIVFNAAMTDYWLGLTSDPRHALEDARAAVDSGLALARLQAYIDGSMGLRHSPGSLRSSCR